MVTLIHGALFGRTILIMSENAQSRDILAGQFQSFQCHILLAVDGKMAHSHLQVAPKVDAIVIEVSDAIAEAFDFIDKIVEQEMNCPPIFLITDKIDMHFGEAFFRGAEAIFFKPINLPDVSKGIAYSLEVAMEHAARQHERKRLRRARIEFTSESTFMASSGNVLNISKGGIYATSMYNHPSVNECLNFRITCSLLGDLEIRGRGIVKWVRSKSEFGRPPGFGIEFKDLTQENQAKVDKILQNP